jgi:hypothetical protein
VQQPDIHLDVVRARHSDLLRQARAGELAARLAAGRREERRSLAVRLRESPATRVASSSAAGVHR